MEHQNFMNIEVSFLIILNAPKTVVKLTEVGTVFENA